MQALALSLWEAHNTKAAWSTDHCNIKSSVLTIGPERDQILAGRSLLPGRRPADYLTGPSPACTAVWKSASLSPSSMVLSDAVAPPRPRGLNIKKFCVKCKVRHPVWQKCIVSWDLFCAVWVCVPILWHYCYCQLKQTSQWNVYWVAAWIPFTCLDTFYLRVLMVL